MSQFAAVMPEARFRSTKKRVQPGRSNQTNSRSHTSAPAAAATKADAKLPTETATQPVAKAEKKAKPEQKLGEAIASWWPVGVAIFLSGFAQEWHSMAVLGGVWYQRVFFPLALLATHREIGLDSTAANSLPQLMVTLQIPLEGLWVKLTLARGSSLKMAATQLIGLHAVCTLVLWLLSMAQ